MKCKVCKRQHEFTMQIARTLFMEGYHVGTILRMLELEGYPIPRSTWYAHFKNHEPIIHERKANRSFRLRRHGKGTKPTVEAVSPKILEMMEACK